MTNFYIGRISFILLSFSLSELHTVDNTKANNPQTKIERRLMDEMVLGTLKSIIENAISDYDMYFPVDGDVLDPEEIGCIQVAVKA